MRNQIREEHKAVENATLFTVHLGGWSHIIQMCVGTLQRSCRDARPQRSRCIPSPAWISSPQLKSSVSPLPANFVERSINPAKTLDGRPPKSLKQNFRNIPTIIPRDVLHVFFSDLFWFERRAHCITEERKATSNYGIPNSFGLRGKFVS